MERAAMKLARLLNAVGLICGIAGTVIVTLYGLPDAEIWKQVAKTAHEHRESAFEIYALTHVVLANTYSGRVYWGMPLITLGFVAQFCALWFRDE